MANSILKSSILHSLPRALLTAAAVVLLVLSGVHAQDAGTLTVTNPDTSAYPEITASFKAVDSEGNFVMDLRPSELRVIEDGKAITDYELELVETGVRFFVAVNEGPTLANRYSGASRFDRIKTALYNWFSTRPPDSADEFSLFTNEGTLSFSTSTPEGWTSAVESYLPDLRKAVPGPASLSSAVDSALSLDLETGKSSAVLYITPMPSAVQLAGIQEIISRAGSNGIRVFIWLIGPQDYASTGETRLLTEYAAQTGGRFFLFSGSETLPDLNNWLQPLSFVYRLAYTTPANTSGDYALVLEIVRGEIRLESQPVTYSLTISPPNPIFLSPPVQITRSWTQTTREKESTLVPLNTDIKIMVEFPDGIERDLVSSRLYVDDVLMDENTSAPFDTFSWDISAYTETASHHLRASIEDLTGLRGETIEMPVEVIVEEKPRTTIKDLFTRLNLVNIAAGAIIALALAGLLATLIRILRKKGKAGGVKKKVDLVTEPVEINGEYLLSLEIGEEVIKWPTIRGVGLAPARLLQKKSASPNLVYLQEIPLGNDESVIGSDSRKSDFVLTHPSVSPRHARIFKDVDGNFRIADAGSTAGTWVNYAPISTRGLTLEHGDLVQFGRLSYTFEIHGATPRRAQLLPHKED